MMRKFHVIFLPLVLIPAAILAFIPRSHQTYHRSKLTTLQAEKNIATYDESTSTTTSTSTSSTPMTSKETTEALPLHWNIAPTLMSPESPPLPPTLLDALQTQTHPVESQDELGNGVFITEDWRKAWYSYESPPEEPDLNLICPDTGEAEYEITEIDGELPDALEGVMYRNGPGKFGLNGERVAHVLDADGLILRVHFMKKGSKPDGKRKVMFRCVLSFFQSCYFHFQTKFVLIVLILFYCPCYMIKCSSRFVHTNEFKEEKSANKFLYRGTFGTARRGLETFFPVKRLGINEDPPPTSTLSKIVGNAFRTSIKNTANTQVISFGGKLLALFEAGLPYRLDPVTLDTLGEDDLDGTLGRGVCF